VEFVEVPRDRFEESLDDRVRLVIASVMSYLDGYRFPLDGLREKLDRTGTLLYLDGTQGCGALHLDVRKIRPDVLGVHGYKWMLSPTGAGFAYVRPELRQWLEPNVIGWRSHHSWQDLDNLHHGMPEWAASAHRYEGYMPALPLLYAMERSVDLMLELDPVRIESRVLQLVDGVKAVVEKFGGSVANAKSPIAACRFPERDSSELSRALNARNVLTSARHGRLRLSFHLYNDESDIAAVDAALGEILG
jgi:selenocysteine lyase/cysteine desulfurase